MHYWHTGDAKEGMRVPIIAETMTSPRHFEILSHLSFALPTTEVSEDKLQKLREVDDLLKAACQRGWDIEPDVTLDESRLRLHSRMCSFVTQMMCKPIKNGLTNYCLNFAKSSYLYTWEWCAAVPRDELEH